MKWQTDDNLGRRNFLWLLSPVSNYMGGNVRIPNDFAACCSFESMSSNSLIPVPVSPNPSFSFETIMILSLGLGWGSSSSRLLYFQISTRLSSISSLSLEFSNSKTYSALYIWICALGLTYWVWGKQCKSGDDCTLI